MWASVKLWIFFPFIPSFFLSYCVSYLLLACVAEGLDNLFIQVLANKHDIFSLLCVAESLNLKALVLIVGSRSTRHQNAQTRKIFSCLFQYRDWGYFGDCEQVGIISVWTGSERKKLNRTELKLVNLNRF
jgi:hypothetical protein